APLDQRQVNTGRFSLFLPETREFFLQDAAVFEFAGRTFGDDERNGMPFFSRRIGFAGGEAADILAGGKLSGQIGPVSIGALSTRTKSNQNAAGQTLSVARASAEVLEESRIGFIVTNGDPLGLVQSTVAGADFQYRNSNLIGEGVLFADLGYLRSWQDGDARDLFGAELAYEADKWNWKIRLRDIERDFDPRLGFVNRSGVRSIFGDGFRLWRPAGIGVREVETGVSAKAVADAGGGLLDQEIEGRVRIEWVTDDELTARVKAYDLNILEPFKVAGIVDVPSGTYRYLQREIKAESSPARRVSAGMEVKWGRIYDGTYLMLKPNLRLRPSRHFEISLNYDRRLFDLPDGRIAVHVASSEVNFSLSPRLQFNALAQYDNISESLALSGRMKWEIDPATELQFIIRHSAEIEGMYFPQGFFSTDSSATIRLSRVFRM
ncbi:MAG: hypothetical protein RIE56_12270, partial [Amphiplicatus sp.]